MGKFVKAVRDGEVRGPLRSGFKPSTWEASYAKLGDNEEDRPLLEAGLLAHEKLGHIRDSLKLTFSDNLKATTKIRAFVAASNYNLRILKIRTREALQKIAAEKLSHPAGGQIMMHELAAVKIELPIGAEFSPDEVIQTMVDGLEIPLKAILGRSPDLQGAPDFGNLNWDDVRLEVNLGGLYAHVEDLWDDCLWNDYQAVRDGRLVTFSPRNLIWEVRSVVSRVRLGSLSREFAARADHALTNLKLRGLVHTLGMLNIKKILKEGRQQTIQLVPFGPDSNDAHSLLTMRSYASEPYYTELLDEAQPLLNGATLDQLLTAWMIVSRTSAYLQDEMEKLEIRKPSEPNTWLPYFAPVLQTQALVQAVSAACKTPLAQSKAILDFFIFRGKTGQELWAQPLLPVGTNTIVPLFATTSSPNLRRLVDVWLKQLGVDLSARGPAFETHIRASIRQDIAESRMLHSSSQCLAEGLMFSPIGGREEEIDVVAVVGDVVIIGEAKCFLEPTEAKQIAMHRGKVIQAVEQVKRKADAVQANKEGFRERLARLGVELATDFEVLPIVILNSAIHCGVAVDGVPIVDEYILGVFFTGELVELAMTEPHKKGFNTIKKRVLYDSPEEASKSIKRFLLSPPQMSPLLKGIQKRWVPIFAVNDVDWIGNFLALECIPNIDSMPELDEVAPPFQ